MSFFKDFRDFAVKGNVVDLAVGVVIGSAFGKIVTSFVNDIIMPLVTLITGKIDFSSLVLYLNGKNYATVAAGQEAGAPILYYGTFITNIVDFLIVALSIFIVIRQINKFKKKPEPAPVTTKECPFCRTAIHIEATRCPHCTSELK